MYITGNSSLRLHPHANERFHEGMSMYIVITNMAALHTEHVSKMVRDKIAPSNAGTVSVGHLVLMSNPVDYSSHLDHLLVNSCVMLSLLILMAWERYKRGRERERGGGGKEREGGRDGRREGQYIMTMRAQVHV